jgi:hypothetical protein
MSINNDIKICIHLVVIVFFIYTVLIFLKVDNKKFEIVIDKNVEKVAYNYAYDKEVNYVKWIYDSNDDYKFIFYDDRNDSLYTINYSELKERNLSCH